MNTEALKAAIQKRRGKDFDVDALLQILMGGNDETAGVEAQDEEEAGNEKLMDLAPEVDDAGGEMVKEAAEGEVDPMAPAPGKDAKGIIAKMLEGYGKSPMRDKMAGMKKA